MKTEKEKALSAIESKLATTLKRVKPSNQFVAQTGERVRIAPPQVIIRRAYDSSFWVLVIGGALSGALLLLTTARALFYLFGRSK